MKSFKLLPSIDRLLEGAVTAARRFPLALLCATVGAITAVILTEHRGLDEPSRLLSLVATMSLGLPLFIALVTMGERYRWSSAWRIGAQLIGVVALVGYFFSLPKDLFHPTNYAIRHAILLFGLHFFVAIGPFLQRGAGNGFWQYNKSLLLKFLTAAFYSAALFIGFCIALAAADYLFGFDVDGDTYAELWMLMAGLVNTWIFLALVPSDYAALEASDEYPAGLKIFSQYVLLPLVGLYFVILFAYELKIIFEWNWPKGWVSQMVLWYAVVGTLALLLLHPLREREGSKWIGKFGNWFFRLLVPLTVMLFLAIRRRIADYGVTEPRYVVLALSFGLSLVVLYFIFSKRKDIRLIPIVLVVLAVLSAYGPISASSISCWSQVSRLEEMLIANGIWKGGAVAKPSAEIPLEQRREMSSVIAYLNEAQGPSVFRRWLSDSELAPIQKTFDSNYTRYSANDTVAAMFGFDFNWSRYYGNEGKWVSLWVEDPYTLDIAGYERLLSFEYPGSRGVDSAQFYVFNGDSISLRVLPKSSTIQASLKNTGSTVWDTVAVDIKQRVVELYRMDNPRQIPQDSMTFDRSVGNYDLRFLLRGANGERRDSALELTSLNARILVRKQQ